MPNVRSARALLVAVELPPPRPRAEADLPSDSSRDTEPAIAAAESLAELGRLAVTAGLEPAHSVLQRRAAPDPAYFLGSGKAAELRELAAELGCEFLLFDDELSGVQARNLEEATGLEVLDRTQLILRIFASRAQTREGKLQVELALLLYELPRLTGHGTEMSRLGAGLYTRGPGETRLEAQRRTIRTRLADLKREIEELRRHRTLHRAHRRRIPLPVVSLVGYTNAGKSSLLNALTGADVLAEDKLFATLDPTTRRLSLPGGIQALVTDTVGFLRKLPHPLVAAFRATLEEVVESDLLIVVVDAGSELAAEQAATVRQVLAEAGAAELPSVVALNKADLVAPVDLGRLRHEFPGSLAVSAVTGQGLAELREAVAYALRSWQEQVKLLIPYDRGEILAAAHEHGEVISEDWREDGVEVEVSLERAMAARLRKQLQEETVP